MRIFSRNEWNFLFVRRLKKGKKLVIRAPKNLSVEHIYQSHFGPVHSECFSDCDKSIFVSQSRPL